MTTGQDSAKRWSGWTIQIKVWKLLVALVILPILVLWFLVVHQNDEILALIRNEVVTDVAGQRTWSGAFVNTNDRTLRDVAVTVDFLDSQDRPVGKADAKAAELPFSTRLNLQAPLPADAVKLRIYSVQWRMGQTAALMGPFREPWEFGYLMVDPATFNR
ncbi:MAG: FxLYD domain-containing protein [Steroidobacteraceae bacterium]